MPTEYEIVLEWILILLTGNLWDTENGLRCCDELNLVREGFNSGWDKVQGFWKTNQDRDKDVLFKENSG